MSDELNATNQFKTQITPRRLKQIVQLIEMAVTMGAIKGSDRSEPIMRYRDPDKLKKLFTFEIDNHGSEFEEIIKLAEEVILYSAKTGHPRYFYQFSAALDMYGFIGSWLIDVLNVNTFTYECAPVFTLVERFMITEVCKLFGYPSEADGIFTPGGSLANGFAMNLARYRTYPDIKSEGMKYGEKLVLFMSENAHYSMYKMAGMLGIGINNVKKVKTDNMGRMQVQHLQELVLEYFEKPNFKPFMVVATAGTTVLGAFDPLNEISDVCVKFGLWLHVDAAWGGSAIFSKKYKTRLDGIERSDSFTWNPSKSLAVPQQCSVLCVRQGDIIEAAHSFGAQYLFHDKFYDASFDLGDKYLQCGRKPDVFKLWFMWKSKGNNGISQHIDTLLDRAEYLTEKLKLNPNFELVCEPSYINVCFWYLPNSLKNLSVDEMYQKLNKITPKVEEKMLRRGTIMISYQPMRQLPNFFRFVCCNSAATEADCDFLIEEIQNTANQIDM